MVVQRSIHKRVSICGRREIEVILMSVVICRDKDQLAQQAADLFLQLAHRSIEERGRFVAALSGGSTPEQTYALLAQPERASRLDWNKIYLFFGDERFVPHSDPRSNYHMVAQAMLHTLPLPSGHVIPVRTDLPSPEAAAEHYEQTLLSFFALPDRILPPRFDLIFLGLGDDCHTASLFPGAAALKERNRFVVATPPGTLPPPVDRITFTFPIINAARHVVFLVAGSNKAKTLYSALVDRPPIWDCPAVGVRPTDGELLWLVDKEAASLLPPEVSK